MSAKSRSEEEGNLEHEQETLDKEVEGPLLESIALALTVSAMLDRRPACIPQITIKPLLPQHCDKCGEQGDQQARIHEASDSDDIAGRIFLDGWNDRGFIWDGRLVEGEKDCAEKSCRLIVWVRLKFRVDVDDKGGTDGREQTRLREQVR